MPPSVHPAIQALIDQPLASVGLTAVSGVSTALQDRLLAGSIVLEKPMEPLRTALLKKLIDVLNAEDKNDAARLLCVDCLHSLSSVPSTSFREGALFHALQQFTSGTESLLSHNRSPNNSNHNSNSNTNSNVGPSASERNEQYQLQAAGAAETSVSATQRHVVVLLLRCSGYARLKAGDLLSQVCQGQVDVFAEVLLNILERTGDCEWPLLESVMRCLYELTTPSSYFSVAEVASTPSSSSATTTTIQSHEIASFQKKMDVLLARFEQQRVVERLAVVLTKVWASSCQDRSLPLCASAPSAFQSSSSSNNNNNNNNVEERVAADVMGKGIGALGLVDVLRTVTTTSPAQQEELLRLLGLLRYLSRLLHNMAEFSENYDQLRRWKELLWKSASCQALWATCVVPAVMAGVHVWALELSAATTKAASPSSSTTTMKNLFLDGALENLRVLRLALYRSSTTASAAAALSPASGTALDALAGHVASYLPHLRHHYLGLFVLVLTVEVLCNVNAGAAAAPLSSSLKNSFQRLLTAIAADKAPISVAAIQGTTNSDLSGMSTASGMTLALTFAAALCREESPYFDGVQRQSDSILFFYHTFKQEVEELQQDANTYAMLEQLEFQMETLQMMLMQLALSQLLGSLALDDDSFYNSSDRTNHNIHLIEDDHHGTGTSSSPSKKSGTVTPTSKRKKQAHPKAFCCDLSGKLMKEPVVLRNGHKFELDALQRVVDEMGHVDPLTGEMIDDDIDVDEELRQKIAAYRVERAAAAASP